MTDRFWLRALSALAAAVFGRPYAKALRIMPEAMDDQEPLPVSPVCPFGSIEELFSEP